MKQICRECGTIHRPDQNEKGLPIPCKIAIAKKEISMCYSRWRYIGMDKEKFKKLNDKAREIFRKALREEK